MPNARAHKICILYTTINYGLGGIISALLHCRGVIAQCKSTQNMHTVYDHQLWSRRNYLSIAALQRGYCPMQEHTKYAYCIQSSITITYFLLHQWLHCTMSWDQRSPHCPESLHTSTESRAATCWTRTWSRE